MLVLIVVKISDDISIDGNYVSWHNFVKYLGQVYKLGTVSRTPVSFFHFGLNIFQLDDFSNLLSFEDKIQTLVHAEISRLRRKDDDKLLSPHELHVYHSFTVSIGFIGQTACPLGIFIPSYLQQNQTETMIQHLWRLNHLI